MGSPKTLNQKMKNKRTFKALILFTLAFVTTSLTMTEIITMDRYVLNILFLSMFSLLTLAIFKKDLSELYSDSRQTSAVLLVISFLIHLATVFIVRTFLETPSWPFDIAGTSPLLMNDFFVWTKPFDVLVQQLLILVLVKKLDQYGQSLQQITTMLVCGFGLVHVVQMVRTDVIVGLTFASVAIIFSFVFPYMILKVKHGCVYNFMIHLGVYDLFALLAWIIF